MNLSTGGWIFPTRVGVNLAGRSKFTGSVAEAALWNAAPSDAEIAVLAASFSLLFVKPGNLVAYWPLIRAAAGYMTPMRGWWGP
jgi:hypothetical protein